MNTQTPFGSALPFFDTSAKRVRLPQPTSSPRAHRSLLDSDAFSFKQKSHRAHTRRAAQHSRTPSWSSSSSSDQDLPKQNTTSPTQYPQCFTPQMSRSSSPMEGLTLHPTSISMPNLIPRSPPMTPPTIQASLPTAPMGQYRLRLEPLSHGETPHAVVVFPDAARPTRGLLLVGPAIARYIRERGKSARMHPYRVVFRPSA